MDITLFSLLPRWQLERPLRANDQVVNDALLAVQFAGARRVAGLLPYLHLPAGVRVFVGAEASHMLHHYTVDPNLHFCVGYAYAAGTLELKLDSVRFVE